MLDLRWVVENRAAVEQMLADRGGTLDLSRGDPWALDGERRALLQKVEQLRHRQKVCGEEIARRGRAREDASDLKTEMKGVSDEIKALETRLAEVEEAIRQALLVIPNVPDPSVPRGADASANVEVRRVGDPPRFDFKPRAHFEIGPELGNLVRVAFWTGWRGPPRTRRSTGRTSRATRTRIWRSWSRRSSR